MPENEEQQKLYDDLIYERWENKIIASEYFKGKPFKELKAEFDVRIVKTLHSEEELQKEINQIRQTYEQPEKKIDKGNEHFNVHLLTFRKRLSGRNPRKDIKLSTNTIPGFVEGEHAYQYYAYLVGLQRNPNWLNEIKNVEFSNNVNEAQVNSSLSSKTLSFYELMQMQKGKIPLTKEGETQIKALNDQAKAGAKIISGITQFQSTFSSVSPLLTLSNNAFSKFLPEGIRLAEVIQGNQTFVSGFSKAIESIQKALGPHIDLLSTAKTSIFLPAHIATLFERLKSDPELKRRMELLDEKRDLLYDVIEKWKAHIIYRMKQMPFDHFADHFEYACYSIIDDARNNEELAAICSQDFINVLLDVAVRINIEAERDFEERVKKELIRQGLPQSGCSDNLALNEGDFESKETFIQEFKDQEVAHNLVKKLINLYQGKKPKQYVYMLYALYDLDFINHPTTINQQRLHLRLTATFGRVGTRQNLNSSINKLNAPTQQESADMQRHKLLISQVI